MMELRTYFAILLEDNAFSFVFKKLFKKNWVGKFALATYPFFLKNLVETMKYMIFNRKCQLRHQLRHFLRYGDRPQLEVSCSRSSL
mgnify:CR=1 FL=1